MIKLAMISLLFLLITCTHTTQTIVQENNMFEEKGNCNIEVYYSSYIRVSTFHGTRNGILFQNDTFSTPGSFNGLSNWKPIPSPSFVECDSVTKWWRSQGNVWRDTTTSNYGTGDSIWLDTFYFQYNITKIDGFYTYTPTPIITTDTL